MADPFSVGAGVVGVISLGISVCQGLAAYYGAFTESKRETTALIQKVEGLHSTLEQLRKLLGSFQDPLSSPSDEVHLVTQQIKHCRDGLQNLSDALSKCHGCDAMSVIKKRGWSHARKMLYPFKRETIMSLTGTVSSLQSNLDTALLVLNLALSKRSDDRTTLVLDRSTSIETSVTNISTTLDGVAQQQQQILQIVQSFLHSTQAGAASPRMLPPATLQSLCDQQQVVNRQVRKCRRSWHAPKTSGASCTCPQESSWRWKLLPLFQSHRFGCPLYFQEKKMAQFRGQYVFCNQLLRLSIQFSTSAADGFTIHHSFNARPVVPNDAPAFKLIGEFSRSLLEGSKDVSSGSVLLQLQHLFEEGKASPYDTLSDGTTLLHYAVEKFWYGDDRINPIQFEIIETLALVYRVPLNEVRTRYGKVWTALDSFLGMPLPWPLASPIIEKFASFAQKMLVNGGEITEYSVGWTVRLQFSGTMTHFVLPRVVNELCPQELGLSDLEVSILKRSEDDLRRLLGRPHHAGKIRIKEGVFWSLVEWPLGLKLILQSRLISYRPYLRDGVFMKAVLSSQKESVALLLAAGWPISPLPFEMAASLSERLKVFRMLVDALVKRRRQLLTLAREKLNLNELAMHADMDDLSGPNCRTIYEALKKHVPNIDHIISSQRDFFRVYEHVDYNCQAADILYEADFVNIEEGRSPISHLGTPGLDKLCDYLDLCSWFLSKGASLYSQFPETSTLPIHHIAKSVGQWLNNGIIYPKSQLHTILKTAISRQGAILKDVLTDTEHRDSCSCACSVGGCLPSTIFVREAVWPQIRWSWTSAQPDHALAKLIDILEAVASDDMKEMHDILTSVVLRSCTFKSLQITHTCRYHDEDDEKWGRVKLDDVPEIQSEQRHLIDRLEELVTEFEGKYKELNVSLREFLDGYWTTRMDEIHAEEDVFDEEEAQRMREVGVIVECPSSDSE